MRIHFVSAADAFNVTTAATNGGSAMLNKHVYNKNIVSKVCA